MPAHGPTAPPQMTVSQMLPDHPLPLSPMHLRMGRYPRPLQLSQLLLLRHPHQHPHWVLELLCLWKSGYSQSSVGPLKQTSRLSPWPGNLMAETEGRGILGHGPPSRPSAPSLLPVALGVRLSLLWPRHGMRTLLRSAPRELGKLPKESCCPVTSLAAEGSSQTGSI